MTQNATAQEALQALQSHHNVFIHTAAAAPQQLVHALAQRHPEVKGVTIYQLHTEGAAPYAEPGMEDSFRIKALFVGKNIREAVDSERASYVPMFLSEIPNLFKSGTVKIDVALITVSPPDKHGFCSLGTSVDTTLAAVHCAQCVIAQVNHNMPRTHGDSIIHQSKINTMVWHDEPIPEMPAHTISPVEQAIGENVAELIEDGATLQMGIGAIPNAALACLGNHKNLGIHSEMFAEGILPLVRSGVINGEQKKIHPGMIVSSFLMGNRELYDFIDDNPSVRMMTSDYVNRVDVIRRNPRVVAINSAVEIDLTGQVCADSIGNKIYSGVGGQMDFIRGASLSEGGKPIIAMPSVTGRGESKIVPYLKQGAGVVTTRAHIHYVVTEYGVANLYGKSIEERVKALAEIAHPNHREFLAKEGREILL